MLYILADKFLTRFEMEEVKEVCRMKSLLQELWEKGIQQENSVRNTVLPQEKNVWNTVLP